MDVFDEMVAKERFIELVANGTAPVNAGIIVGWNPKTTRKWMRDVEFAEIVQGARDRANGSIEEALYQRALAGNVAAMQMWLFNRSPDEWRDVKRIEIRSEHRVEIAQVESVKAGVLELLREQGATAIQALPAAEVIDVDGVES